MPDKPEISGAILAGGRNLRMGARNKALLQLGGRTFLERTVACLRPLFTELMIIGPDAAGYGSSGLPVYPDRRPGNGSLGGILTALTRSSAAMTFCVACDMPFLRPEVVTGILERAGEGWEVVIPRLPEGLEPLCAVYASALAPSIAALLDGGERRIRRVVDQARTLYIDTDELRAADPGLLSFFNINTPEDFAAASRLAGEEKP